MPADPKPEDWTVLGVAQGCTWAEARAAFVAMASALHPDRHPDLDGADRARLDRAMAALNVAWDRIEVWPGWGRPAAPDAGTAAPEAAAPETDDGVPTSPPSGFTRILGYRHSHLGDHLRLIGEGPDLLRLAGWKGGPCRRLSCADRPIRDEHLVAAIPILSGLRSLDLDGTGVGDRAVAHLERLVHLDDLHLCDTAVTNASLGIVARLPALHSLSVAGTAVTDAGLAYLAGHANLAVLNLRGTKVAGPGLAALAECPRLFLLSLPHVRREDRRALAERRPDLNFA